MSDSNYVFNPIDWATTQVQGLSEQAIEELDERYINVGENVLDQNINNLNLINLNIGSGGKIYFNNDNTTQTTAYNPSYVLNQILLLKQTDNT